MKCWQRGSGENRKEHLLLFVIGCFMCFDCTVLLFVSLWWKLMYSSTLQFPRGRSVCLCFNAGPWLKACLSKWQMHSLESADAFFFYSKGAACKKSWFLKLKPNSVAGRVGRHLLGMRPSFKTPTTQHDWVCCSEPLVELLCAAVRHDLSSWG